MLTIDRRAEVEAFLRSPGWAEKVAEMERRDLPFLLDCLEVRAISLKELSDGHPLKVIGARIQAINRVKEIGQERRALTNEKRKLLG